jgi:hypothetical protein
MTELFIILGLLFVKHFIVDFYLQTNEHVANKGLYGVWKGIEHSLQHGIATAVILVFFVSWPFAILLAIADFVIHYHVDWAKININRSRHLTPSDQQFWFWLGLDQLAHSLTYVWIGWVIS